MHVFFYFFGIPVAAYGLMITLGACLAVAICLILVKIRGKERGQELIDILIFGGYIFLGGFLGAKLLYIITSIGAIDWSRILDVTYLQTILSGGFVFYGGLIGGLGAFLLAGKLHHINTSTYLEDYIFLVPFVHSFGRIGCFLAGCCYGIPYDGIGSVVFPENSFALAGVSLFPIQLVESAVCMLIAILLAFLRFRKDFHATLPLYLLLYGVARFLLEFLRYDSIRGSFLFFSTSQWISMFMVAAAVLMFIRGSQQKPKKC